MLPKLLMLVAKFVTSLLIVRIRESEASLAKPGCQESCGNITIPYPFGIGTGCYLHESFEVFCRGSSQGQVPIWFTNTKNFPILEFSTDLLRVIHESARSCAYKSISTGDVLNLDQYFSFSQHHNLYVAVGCNILGLFRLDPWVMIICESFCNETLIPDHIGPANNCTGFNGCCQLNIPENLTLSDPIISYKKNSSLCAHAFVSEYNASIFYDHQQLQLPVALSWVVAHTTCHQANKTGDSLCGRNSYCVDATNGLVGYNCRCRQGYKGNPYLPNGCQDVNKYCPKQSNHYCEEGEACVQTYGTYKCISLHHNKLNVPVIVAVISGVSAFGAIGYWTYMKLDRIRKTKIKHKFFKKNGGHLLMQKISANKVCVTTIRMYAVEDIEKATGHFSRSRFLGKGGQGTVYKGLFPDGTVAAIKKLNVVNADQSTSLSASGEGLVPRFKFLVKHDRFVEILDKEVVQEAMMDDLYLVAKLAKRCMKTNSKKRPSMKEVVTDLDKLRIVPLELILTGAL
ncbi:hypothetical protein QVD17_21822 [Tagetes erecta]|uniref:Protein kinase domain-containing protein n=1 Tax=Tagetes erecta TaxID=13708 RepID=A0AAD8NTC1_TARER|nr:hypothetical protein QVD17_21822 [Tagetes erecta]